MEYLSISDTPRLDTLPDDVLLIIISHLTTAQSVSRLGVTSKRLSRLISDDGWRVFVRNCFYNLSLTPDVLPPIGTPNGWKQFAKRLTSQACDWDRRAFIFHVFFRQGHQEHLWTRNQRGRFRPNSQTVPCHVIVDVHSQVGPRAVEEEETVVWGAGEDLVALKRRKHDNKAVVTQRWQQSKGIDYGFNAGRDDITSLSILRTPQSPQESASSVLVGRASGDLRLIAMKQGIFGQAIRHFRPASTEENNDLKQREIQALDTHENTNLLAAATKGRVLLYPIHSEENADLDGSRTKATTSVEPSEALNLRNVPETSYFRFIRSLKFLNSETIAVGLTSSTEPLRYLQITPSGCIETLAAAPNIAPYHESTTTTSEDSHRLETVRALLPIDASSFASGGGRNAILTSWDDGTIRLQDLRTPSAFDRVYQDHFEPTTPINALAAYGLERFIGGSARGPVLKVFDFRVSNRRYDYIEALACSDGTPVPQPRPPTIVAKPLAAMHSHCDYVRGHLCRWHALSKDSFYRPNCNIYLPKRAGATDAPIYSLARASDVSATLYAGLSGTLVEMSLRSSSSSGGGSNSGSSTTFSSDHHPHPYESSSSNNTPPLYQHHRAKVNFLETGDGIALEDISESQRMPIIRAQSERRVPLFLHNHNHQSAFVAKRNRLDEWLQDDTDSALE